ncbi:MAG TPA: aldose epimerase, partial [Ktedonobacter sp.]|nr:aldose epimerase [Ktedonobacter sp.]
MPFGFALHPYFSTLSGKRNTVVSIPASYVMEADEQLLPTGRLLDVRGIMYAMFDLRRPV